MHLFLVFSIHISGSRLDQENCAYFTVGHLCINGRTCWEEACLILYNNEPFHTILCTLSIFTSCLAIPLQGLLDLLPGTPLEFTVSVLII